MVGRGEEKKKKKKTMDNSAKKPAGLGCDRKKSEGQTSRFSRGRKWKERKKQTVKTMVECSVKTCSKHANS